MKRLIAFCTLLLAAGALLFAGAQGESTGADEAAGAQIDWESPIPMVERLTADQYVLPEGWEEATEGVDRIVLGNSGGLRFDIATVINAIQFTEMTGIEVDYIPIATNVAFQKSLSTLIARDPGVHGVLVNGVANEMTTYAAMGALHPVDAMWSDEVADLYIPAVRRQFLINGNWWSSPVVTSGWLPFYRPSMLEGAGVEEVPTTYAELRSAMEQIDAWLEETGQTDVRPIVFTGASVGTTMRPTLLAQGSDFFDPDAGRWNFDTPEFRNAFEYWVNLVLDGLASESVLTLSIFEAGQVFGTGRAAFTGQLTSAFSSQLGTEFPEVAGDWEPMASLKWNEDWDYPTTPGDTNNALLIGNYIEQPYQQAVMLYLDFFRSKQALRYEIVVEGNESPMPAAYEGNPTQFIDWDLVDRAAESVEIVPPARVDELPNREMRLRAARNSTAVAFPPGLQRIMQSVAEQFSLAATGATSIDDAIEEIISVADEISAGR